MPSASDGVLAGRQFSTGACHAIQPGIASCNLACPEVLSGRGTSLTLFHLLPPRDIRPLLIGWNEPVTTGSSFIGSMHGRSL